jgi:2,4-dienoyl-CoA reductase-like NADH-dependent reductase (Old Yellow Enzyme family)
VTRELAFLAPGRIGRLTLKNRLVRAATSETMATAEGFPTEALVALYQDLAAGGAGLIITGHIYVEPRGQYEPRQLGLHEDALVPAFARVTDAVHANGGVIFAELSHAGSQSTMSAIEPIAPFVIANAISSRTPREMSDEDIDSVVEAFAAAARRAVAAGFDGIHLHGGNGYLLAQFNSPHTNRRTDAWGGDPARRSRFMMTVFRAVREAVGSPIPITARLGVEDAVGQGLALQEGVERASQLAALGLDAIEVTYGIMSSYRQNILPYAGNKRWHELADGIVHRLLAARVPEAYYRPFAHAVKQAVAIPVILVGGLRSTAMMDDVIRSGDADFLALARPFVRQPDLPNRIIAGERGAVDCVSCNICFKHEGLDPLQCWRTPKIRLLSHLFSRAH